MITLFSCTQKKDDKRNKFVIKLELTGKGNATKCSNVKDYNSYFLRISLTNNMDSVVSFWMMNCSWIDNWVIDNSNLKFCFNGCDKNVPVKMTLKPKTSMVFYGVIHPIDTTIKVEKFKLGFVTLEKNDFSNYHLRNDTGFMKNKKTYWSNDVRPGTKL